MGEMLIVSGRLLHSRHHSSLHVMCTAEVTRAHPVASKEGDRSSHLTDPPVLLSTVSVSRRQVPDSSGGESGSGPRRPERC